MLAKTASPLRVLPTADSGVLPAARAAQTRWAKTSWTHRAALLRRVRRLLVERAEGLAGEVGRVSPRSRAETVVAELLPLADALRFLERRAARILCPRRLGRRWGPGRRRLEIVRDPLGVVLVIAPGNYPLFLPGVQVAQALAAGNAVLLKPAPGQSAVAQALRALFVDAGFEADLVAVLPETVEAARETIRAGVDHVVLTGAAETGRAVLRDLAPSLTPATMELSGCDAVFVRRDADLDLVARALRFGLVFHGSRTCIAPRRVFVPRDQIDALVTRLQRTLADAPPTVLDERTVSAVYSRVQAACDQGARLAVGSLPVSTGMRPIVLAGVRPAMEIARTDVFAPVLSLLTVEDDDDALAQAAACPYALGATVFGTSRGARALAARIRAGVVVVNDMIAPTADPRVPFGGRGESGFGVTRGAEGLLALTAPKTVIVTRGRSRRHLDDLRGGEDRLFLAWLRWVHAPSRRARLGAAVKLMMEGKRYVRARGATGETKR